MEKEFIFNWDNEKNEQLKKGRSISFEQVVVSIENGNLLDVLEHPNKDKFLNQVLMIVAINNYVYVVPTVIDTDKRQYFMKTIYPSRKYKNKY